MRARTVIFFIIGAFLAVALLDSIGIFDDRSYFEVPHGGHTHYLPKDCDPPVPVSNAPTVPPLEGQKIDCSGQIVPEPSIVPE